MPRAADFARARNWVVPPHERVSGLSPYLRHRLVLESELIGAVWSAHPPAAVEKLVSEVLWRTYWKGWLEMRPQVWRATWISSGAPWMASMGQRPSASPPP